MTDFLSISPADFAALRADIKDVNSKLTTLAPQRATPNIRYLTRDEVARSLRISLSTLHRIVKNGYLPCFKVGRRTLFKEADVQECLIKINSIK